MASRPWDYWRCRLLGGTTCAARSPPRRRRGCAGRGRELWLGRGDRWWGQGSGVAVTARGTGAAVRRSESPGPADRHGRVGWPVRGADEGRGKHERGGHPCHGDWPDLSADETSLHECGSHLTAAGPGVQSCRPGKPGTPGRTPRPVACARPSAGQPTPDARRPGRSPGRPRIG